MSDEEHIKILKQRYAKGEISKKEYEEMKEEFSDNNVQKENVQKENIQTIKKNGVFDAVMKVFILIGVVLIVIVLLGTGIINTLFSSAVSHSGGLANPTVVVSGYAKTNIGTFPTSITFGSSTVTVSSNGYYSVSLDNDQAYPISIAYSSVTGNSNCNAGDLNLQAPSSNLFYNATC